MFVENLANNYQPTCDILSLFLILNRLLAVGNMITKSWLNQHPFILN